MVTLSTTQKARVKQVEGLGLRLGADFEVRDTGILLISLGELFAWNEVKDRLSEIEEYKELFGLGKPVEYDAETLAALNEDHILSQLNDHIGSNGEDPGIMEEVVVAQLEATIAPLIEALEVATETAKAEGLPCADLAAHEAEMRDQETPTVVMKPLESGGTCLEELTPEQRETVEIAYELEPEAAREEPIFTITNTGATGVYLSKRLRKAIARRVKEIFSDLEWTEDVAPQIEKECLARWGINRNTQRAAYACKRYAMAVERSLDNQRLAGAHIERLAINSYWA